ncbi:hypothetical protein EJ02DRAFT_417356 [Clathrospora elynae]|uniref:Uncharacterized protein n=1 Tax=Clathrospora elynae TaxID=706981 RepID=A0A6A5T824_9PLEO|nr:hypothetical protein EJ02DRAFT_417356 [Clathrospora elynae]
MAGKGAETEPQRRLAERRAVDRGSIDCFVASNVEIGHRELTQSNVDPMPNKEDMRRSLAPVVEGLYDMSLTMERLHNARVQDNIEAYRHFIDLAPITIIRDMMFAQDKEIDRQQERRDDLAALLDYCMKTHLVTSAATLKFMRRVQSANDLEAESLREMLVTSRKIGLEKYGICTRAGIFTEENTRDNIVHPAVFETERIDGD